MKACTRERRMGAEQERIVEWEGAGLCLVEVGADGGARIKDGGGKEHSSWEQGFRDVVLSGYR